MTYAPIVVLIGFSTLFLQYHYVVDLLAGLAIAVFANRTAWVLGRGWISKGMA
jgi:membrane-associated phospholipid phosphatase